jgi:DNA-binding PadR family transcriptional regulator
LWQGGFRAGTSVAASIYAQRHRIVAWREFQKAFKGKERVLMFSDRTLTPKEATRLAALGTLALGPMTYSDLATEIRHFTGSVIGPSPEIMGHSIELLRYEDLIETCGRVESDHLLRLTEKGHKEIETLLTANLRAAGTALNKLVIALKFRFLHLLPPADQCAQADLLVDVCEQELARLADLRGHHATGEGYLAEWLEHDIELLEQRLRWLTAFRNRLCRGS